MGVTEVDSPADVIRAELDKLLDDLYAVQHAVREVECFVLAAVSHPAFDAVRVADLRNRSEVFKEQFKKHERAYQCLRFLQWLAEAYDSTDTMHPLARLFKFKVSPSTDAKGNACLYTGGTIIDAIEHWMSETSYASMQEVRTR